MRLPTVQCGCVKSLDVLFQRVSFSKKPLCENCSFLFVCSDSLSVSQPQLDYEFVLDTTELIHGGGMFIDIWVSSLATRGAGFNSRS